MKNLFFFVIIYCGFSLSGMGFEYAKQPYLDVIHYHVNLEIDNNHDSIFGKTTIQFKLTESKQNLVFDLQQTMNVVGVLQNNQPLKFNHQNNQLMVELKNVSTTTFESIVIYYKGIPNDGLIISKNKYNDRTFFADNWPNRAHHWFPCIDHPSDKATVNFSIIHPSDYQVISNGILKESSYTEKGKILTSYQCFEPLPTKVMVFGAAKFAVDFLQSQSGIEVQNWVYWQDREKGFYDYALTTEIVDFFVEKLAPYPYQKLANVQSKTRYGGMENAGCIFYHEGSVVGDRSEAELFAHEIAHQWFGNTVTEKNWEDIWLSESFATYLAGLYLKNESPQLFKNYMDLAQLKVEHFSTKNKTATIIPQNISDLNEILNPYTYQKGAWVLHMITEQYFNGNPWTFLKPFYEKHQQANASTSDFLKVLFETNNSVDTNLIKQQWLYMHGLPIIEFSWNYDEKKQEVTVQLKQIQPEKIIYQLPLEIGLTIPTNVGKTIHKIQLTEKSQSIKIPVSSMPSAVELDPLNKVLLLPTYKDF